jgi:hypothetical protein
MDKRRQLTWPVVNSQLNNDGKVYGKHAGLPFFQIKKKHFQNEWTGAFLRSVVLQDSSNWRRGRQDKLLPLLVSEVVMAVVLVDAHGGIGGAQRGPCFQNVWGQWSCKRPPQQFIRLEGWWTRSAAAFQQGIGIACRGDRRLGTRDW